jgi:hypothetical protein
MEWLLGMKEETGDPTKIEPSCAEQIDEPFTAHCSTIIG